MHIDFTAILNSLGVDAPFKIANEVTPGNEYLYASILPERPGIDYVVSEKYMTVRSMMAGAVGMDSPYPPTGFVETRTELLRTIKVANTAVLPEAAIRHLQQLMSQGSPSPEQLAQEVLNFYDKVVLQPHFDTAEWLRMQALLNAAISWTFGDVDISVTYTRPAANTLTTRTVASTEAYHLAGSKFWEDVIAARSILRGQLAACIAHPTTIDAIISNADNNLRVLDMTELGDATVQRYVGTTEQLDTDVRYRLNMIAYGLEGEVFDTDTVGDTFAIPFMPPGKLLFLGRNQYDRVYRVGLGSTVPADYDNPIGYTHLAPTVEGANRPGRWGRMFTPENEPWQLVADGVTNLMPVIEAPEKIVVATTEMP